MISDDKRRKVAARIRELMSECLTIPFFMVIAQAINDCLPDEGGSVRAYRCRPNRPPDMQHGVPTGVQRR